MLLVHFDQEAVVELHGPRTVHTCSMLFNTVYRDASCTLFSGQASTSPHWRSGQAARHRRNVYHRRAYPSRTCTRVQTFGKIESFVFTLYQELERIMFVLELLPPLAYFTPNTYTVDQHNASALCECMYNLSNVHD